MSKAADFIERHDLDYRNIRIGEQIGTYLEEMEKGLDGQESSLLMLPTYLELEEEVCRNRKVVCVDAGGTNLRIGVAWFDDDGNFRVEDLKRYTMPGVEKELDVEEFFDVMAQLIAPCCDSSKEIVLSFAYRASTTEEIDAEIIEITKEVRVKNGKGRLLAKGILASLERMGIEGADMIVINDAVAAALSGKAEYLESGFGAFTGTILGTGSNSCYVEKNANIGKLYGKDRPGMMVINTEAGSYSKIPRTDIDRDYDAGTIHPGVGISEKMTSGGYLGALCEYTLRRAADEGVFETKAVRQLAGLRSEDVCEYLEEGSGVIEEYMVNEADEGNAKEILENIVLRAARVAALQMAAVAEKSHKANNRLCMSIEGSTYEKMYGLKEELHGHLNEYLQSRGLEAELVTVDKAVLKGCAIAGLSRSGVSEK